MSELVLVLSSALKIGTTAIAGASGYEWEIAYSATSEHYTTPIAMLEFSPRPGQRWRARVRLLNGTWSDWGNETIANPLPGDTDFDCHVGGPDLVDVGHNWGRNCE